MTLRIEVVCALPQAQNRLQLEIRAGSTVQDAIHASRLLARYPEITNSRIGIWGRAVTPQTLLRDRDRIEIYRPLSADPK
jgi:putative ubiquitin-RnfH superfamily antitoxin RatB of RatAB toxin-antitoxin module